MIDDALELAAPVNRGALGPAVAGAWAAIESLLRLYGIPLVSAEMAAFRTALEEVLA